MFCQTLYHHRLCDMLQIYSDLDESYQKRKINEYAIAFAVLGVIL